MNVSTELQSKIDATATRLRAAIAKRTQLANVVTALDAATKHQDQVRSRLNEMDDKERQTMAAWAAAGAAGSAPSFDHAARVSLNQELAEATTKATASKAVIDSMDGELSAAQRELVEATGDLRVHALAVVAENAKRIANEYQNAIVRTAEAKMELLAMDRFFAEKQTLDDMRTTAFIPTVQNAMRHELGISEIEQRAFAEAHERWVDMFSQVLQVNEPTIAG